MLVDLVAGLLRQHAGSAVGVTPADIGVIATYRKQVPGFPHTQASEAVSGRRQPAGWRAAAGPVPLPDRPTCSAALAPRRCKQQTKCSVIKTSTAQADPHDFARQCLRCRRSGCCSGSGGWAPSASAPWMTTRAR